MITQKILKEHLHYCPDSGEFTWIKPTSSSVSKGDVAGTLFKPPLGKTEYIYISLLKHRFRAHRLAWLYVHGELPELHIDHINGVGTDNRISNLRQATNQHNNLNMPRRSDNKSGVTGVSWDKSSGKWRVTIGYNGKVQHIGRYFDLEEAKKQRSLAESRLGFHQNHGRKQCFQ